MHLTRMRATEPEDQQHRITVEPPNSAKPAGGDGARLAYDAFPQSRRHAKLRDTEQRCEKVRLRAGVEINR